MKQKYNKFLALQKYMNFVRATFVLDTSLLYMFTVCKGKVAGNSFLMYFEMFLEIYVKCNLYNLLDNLNLALVVLSIIIINNTRFISLQ